MTSEIIIPRATYRLQFNKDFTFRDATALVPYLADLGISHAYASPYFKARAGSTHGYDIVEHNVLNPEIGTREDLDTLAAGLKAHGMGQILDIVPNHMAVHGDDNPWWMDVLENGPASLYADFYDIDWRPLRPELHGRLLLPVLGAHYGAVLRDGQLRLDFDCEHGEFSVRYFEHRFPLDPKTYPVVLGADFEAMAELPGASAESLDELKSIVFALSHLPGRDDTSFEAREERAREKQIHKRRLAALCQSSPALRDFLRSAVEKGNAGDDDYWRLHDLIEQQAYRLAYWRVASDEINYRRFFDVNTLAGVRQEEAGVFETTHRLTLELLRDGVIDGLRIDHPDGLHDPGAYYQALQEAAGEALGRPAAAGQEHVPAVYMVTEKILAAYEHLPEDWPVHGTTGYDFSDLLNGVFVQPDFERQVRRNYERFVGRRVDFDELLYESKKLIMRVALSSELGVLANQLDRIAQARRETRDFTLNSLRNALMEVVASFPVYRTYVAPGRVTVEDRRYVEWAVKQARKHNPAGEPGIYEFIQSVLLLENLDDTNSAFRERVIRLAMNFPQYTAPVTAKGMEDTAFYRYNPLISLNEVGGDPRRYATSLAAFHHANQERARRWPHALLATSTHDTKRSEDVRARINALSELPGEWRAHVARWARINRGRKVEVDGLPAPSANDEYLIYQTVLGAWPLEELDEAGLAAFEARIQAYMLKAVREAKVRTSWLTPNEEYEAAVRSFVASLLSPADWNLFFTDFLPFKARVARLGLYTSLSQALLKFTVPGVPDIYQGNEVWDFSLVDPDNRRPVDYARRAALLEDLRAFPEAPDWRARVRNLLDTPDDGRAKLYLTWRALRLRARFEAVFRDGEYLPVTVHGERAEHVCAFARRAGGVEVLVVAPRWFARLTEGAVRPLGDVWVDTALEWEPGRDGFRDWFTGERHSPVDGRLQLREVLADFPVAVLVAESGLG